MIIRTILAALMATSLAGAAAAQVVPGPRDEVGEELGELVAPPGGKAYRETWNGFDEGFIEVVVERDGAARMRSSADPVKWMALRPSDLRGLEAEVAATKPSDFAGPNTHNCLDECSYFFLTVAADGESWHGRIGARLGPLHYVSYEMDELAKLRMGGAFAAPGLIWTRPGRERPTPRLVGPPTAACAEGDRLCAHNVWVGTRSELGLLDLTPDDTELWRRSYRLVTIPDTGPPHAVTLTLFDDPRRENCPYPVVFSCPPNIDAARIGSTSGKGRRTDLKRARAFEDAIFEAGLSDMPAGSETPCPQGDSWVLEALVRDRYRAVAGNACDARGLGPAIEALRKMAKR